MFRRIVSSVCNTVGRAETAAASDSVQSRSNRAGPFASPGHGATTLRVPPGLADLPPRSARAKAEAPRQQPGGADTARHRQTIQRNRDALSSWFAAVKAQDAAWNANTNLTTGLKNLVPPTQLLRYDKNPHLRACPEMPDGYSAAKSFVDADQRRLYPADVRRVPGAEDPYAQGSLVLSHVAQDSRKGSSPLSSTTDDDATHTAFGKLLGHSFGGGSAMKIDSSKADVIPPKLAVAMMLFNASEAAHESKPWDWRNDPHLRLNPVSHEAYEHLAEAMVKHGIDPEAREFSKAEKMSVFVLACAEHLIMGATEPGAVTLPGELHQAPS